MKILRPLLKRLLTVSLVTTCVVPSLVGGKLSVGIQPSAQPRVATGAGATRTATAGVTITTGTAYTIQYNKILNNQTQSGSDLYLVANDTNPAGNDTATYAITKVLQVLGSNGSVTLAPQGFATQSPTTVRGVKTDTGYQSPLYNAKPILSEIFSGNVVAVPNAAAYSNTVFMIPISNTQSLLSTEILQAPGGAPITAADQVPVGAGFKPLNDAAGTATASPLLALVSGKDGVYAAVAQGGDFFADAADSRGIAKVSLTGVQLSQTMLNSVSPAPADPAAAPMSLQAVDGVASRADVGAAFYKNPATGTANSMTAASFQTTGVPTPNGTGVVMCYDSYLDRVFVGLKGLRKNLTQGATANQEGGLVGILVGVPNTTTAGTIDFRSVFNNPIALYGDPGTTTGLSQNSLGYIAGVYHGPTLGQADAAVRLQAYQAYQNNDVYVSIEQLKTMHTSTGRSYLIVASEVGGVGGSGNKKVSGLFFMPIAGKNFFDASGAVAAAVGDADVGTIAQSTFIAPATDYSMLPTAAKNGITNTIEFLNTNETRVRQIPVLASQIVSLNVLGDTVSFVVNGNEANGELQGAYQTTAVFDAAGNIASWTPLQRITKEKAVSFVQDSALGNSVYLDSTGETLKVTDWVTNSIASAELITLVKNTFGSVGVRALYAFDSSTPTFKDALVPANATDLPSYITALDQQQLNTCSLLVLLGYDKVMVVQTAYDGYTAQHFKATAAASVAGSETFGAGGDIQNVFVFDSTNAPDLAKIAPLSCAEILKITPNLTAGAVQNNGYIYVGGYKGVCRLQTAAPAGWETCTAANVITGLESFATFYGQNPTFTQLVNTNLKDVCKIISTQGTDGQTSLIAVCSGGYVKTDQGQLDFNGVALTRPANGSLLYDAVLVKQIPSSQIAPVGTIGGRASAASAVTANTAAYLILAVEEGLVVQNLDAAVVAPNDTTLVSLKNSGDMPIQLVYQARDRGGVTGGDAAGNAGAGDLLVLAGSQASGNVSVYRYAVNFDATIANVLQPYPTAPTILDLSTFKRYFGTDGLQYLFANDMSVETGEMLSQVLLSDAISSGTNVAPTSLTGIFNGSGVKIGSNMSPGIVRDPAFGGWIVPSAIGIKIND